jgi:hypothetical protein
MTVSRATIAAEIGVAPNTVLAARNKSTGNDLPVESKPLKKREKRIGKAQTQATAQDRKAKAERVIRWAHEHRNDPIALDVLTVARFAKTGRQAKPRDITTDRDEQLRQIFRTWFAGMEPWHAALRLLDEIEALERQGWKRGDSDLDFCPHADGTLLADLWHAMKAAPLDKLPRTVQGMCDVLVRGQH